MNLVVVFVEPTWAAVQALAHWRRVAGDRVSRVCLYHLGEARRPGEPVSRWVTWVRSEFPDAKVEVRGGGSEAAPVRRQLKAWREQDETGEWVLLLLGLPAALGRLGDAWVGQEGCRVLASEGGGGWTEWVREGDGDLRPVEWSEARRDESDGMAVDRLVNALAREVAGEVAPRWEAAEGLPLLRVTQAAMAKQWDWRGAFEGEGLAVTGGDDRTADLFARYFAAMATNLGAGNTRRQVLTTGGPGQGRSSLVWVNRGGRLTVFDLDLAPADGDGEAALALLASVERVLALRQAFPGAALEVVLVRPGLGAPSGADAWTQFGRVRLWDEAVCRELPARLAAQLGLPMSAEVAEVERFLNSHLATSGRVRLFTRESEAVREQSEVSGGAATVGVDAWLEQVRRGRRQNWLLWTHQGEVWLRLPTEGRSWAAADWGLLLAGLAGVAPDEVKVVPASGDPTSLLVRLPGEAEGRQRVREWLEPFVNRALSFSEARERFAAKARVSLETAPRPSRESPKSPNPAAGQSPRSRSEPPRPPRRPPTGGRPARNSLADLDQALDDALGGGR